MKLNEVSFEKDTLIIRKFFFISIISLTACLIFLLNNKITLLSLRVDEQEQYFDEYSKYYKFSLNVPMELFEKESIAFYLKKKDSFICLDENNFEIVASEEKILLILKLENLGEGDILLKTSLIKFLF